MPARVPTPSRERVLSAPFLRVTAANFCFFLTFASFFLLPLHVRALGGSEQMIGLVMGTGGLAGLASLAVVAPLLDRLGRRVFLLGGLATMALSSAAYLLVSQVGILLFALRVMQGLAFAAGFNAASTLAVDLAPPARRAAALGLFGVSTLTTHALAPALGELLVRVGGFAALFVVATAWSVLGLAIAWPLVPPARAAAPEGPRLGVGGELWATAVTVVCCGVAFGTVITYVPTFAADRALGPVSSFFLAYTVAAVLIRLVAGGLGDAFDRRSVILPALGLLAAAIVWLASVESAPALVAAAVVFGAAQGLVYPTLNAFAVDRADADRMGRVQTLYNGAFNLGVTSGAIGLGWVVQHFGYRTMFLCAAGAAATGLLVFAAGTGNPMRRAALDRAASDAR